MKRAIVLILIVLTLALALTGCGNSIIGTWSASEKDATVTLVFNKDGSGSVSLNDETRHLKYTAEDGVLNAKIIWDDDESVLFENTTYSVDGDELSITIDNDIQIFKKIEK